MKNKLKLVSLVLCFSVGHSSAELLFTIDTFTPNELTISIPVGPNTLDATGDTPVSKDLFLALRQVCWMESCRNFNHA